MPTAPKGTLAGALLAVQRSAPRITKDKTNPAFKGSKYASTDSTFEQLLPLLHENDLLLTQLPPAVGDEPGLLTRITHVPTGDFIESVGLLMLDKQNAQGLGGAITYMRRYALTCLLGLVTEVDDDGNSASKVEVVNRRKTRASKGSQRADEEASDEGGW